jgi:hypothetical protein
MPDALNASDCSAKAYVADGVNFSSKVSASAGPSESVTYPLACNI